VRIRNLITNRKEIDHKVQELKLFKNNYDFVKKGMMVGSSGKQMLGIVSTTIKNK
jgi:hypothetical protein